MTDSPPKVTQHGAGRQAAAASHSHGTADVPSGADDGATLFSVEGAASRTHDAAPLGTGEEASFRKSSIASFRTTRLFVRDLCVFAHHGVMPEETRLGQRFFIDIEAEVEIDAAIRDDDYERAVCYGALTDIAVDIARGRTFRLIETLADRIAEAALAAHPRIVSIEIRVRKPGAALPHALDHVAVTVRRERARLAGFSLGSNQGAREATLQSALALLGTADGVRIDRVSSLYDSAPWGGVAQEGFVNLCVTARTTRAPHALLRLCKEIEASLGRASGIRWGPRVIDVDLLFLDDVACADPVLTLPHPHLAQRAFVLAPLAEIAPGQVVAGEAVARLLATLPRVGGDAVRRETTGEGSHAT